MRDGLVARPAGTAAANGLPDTFPKLLERNARERGARPAMREKDCGIWQTWSWAQVHAEVRAIAAGLAALGVARGDRVAVVGDNRPALYWAMGAAQAVGAIPVPVYQDALAEEMGYVIGHAEADVAVAEDQEQVDKLLAIRERHRGPAHIIYTDSRGLAHYTQAGLLGLAELRERGASFLSTRPGALDAEIARGQGVDVAAMLYTSGTTGQPKGVMLTHDNAIVAAQSAITFDRLTAADEILAYLPMAWAGDYLFSYAAAHVAGFCVSCPESGATALSDLREIGPTVFVAPPRIFESLLTSMSIRMDDAGRLKRMMLQYFLGVARRAGPALLDGGPVSLADRLLYGLGRLLVYGPLKNALGFTRMRLSYTAGEAIGPDIFAFYRSIGLNLKQLYGMTETSVFICLQPDGQVKPDTVGIPAPGVEIQIAGDGEVLVSSPGVFAGYYKDAAATGAMRTPAGWVHTGDAGVLGTDGQLRIVDRIKDVGRLTDGTVFAPKYVESKLTFFSYIKEAVAFGHERAYVSAFVVIDLEAVGHWAERRRLSYASYQDLAAKPEVYDLIQDCVERVNRDLAADPRLAGCQIRRFLVLPKELDADDGELTRMRKVRRQFLAERYAPLIQGLYGAADRAPFKMTVTFEEGRQGTIEAELAIRTIGSRLPAAPGGLQA